MYKYRYSGSGKEGEDLWTVHYNYRRAVNKFWEGFRHLKRAVAKATKLKRESDQATCHVLLSTSKMVAKEQSNIWRDTLSPFNAPITEEEGEISTDESTVESKDTPDVGEDSTLHDCDVPPIPPCTSILKEGIIRFCTGDDTRKAIVSMTTNVGGSSPGGTTVSGIPWQTVWGILSSDGFIHLLSHDPEEPIAKSSVDGIKERTLIRSVPIAVCYCSKTWPYYR